MKSIKTTYAMSDAKNKQFFLKQIIDEISKETITKMALKLVYSTATNVKRKKKQRKIFYRINNERRKKPKLF